MEDRNKALQLFDDAASLSDKARTPQHKARALSRIATVMADLGLEEHTVPYLRQAAVTAKTEASQAMRRYSFYEIVGSAYFANNSAVIADIMDDIPTAPFGSASSLRDATMRDIAWGLARHGDWDRAAAIARAIESPRERVQALSRLVRLIRNPDMNALPRYL